MTEPLDDIAPKILSEILEYSPESGDLIWRHRRVHFFSDGKRSAEHSQVAWNSKHANRPALTMINGSGYKCGRIFGRIYSAHRVIWAIQTGEWPTGQIDHVDQNKKNNLWANLRVVAHAENMRNKPLSNNNTSGHTGVHWYKPREKWCARIPVEGKLVHLGLFDDLNEAIIARKTAEKNIGYHPNHGKLRNT